MHLSTGHAPASAKRPSTDILADRFGLTRPRAAFIAAIFWSAERGRTGPEIAKRGGISINTIRSAYVRTRDLGVTTDGASYFLTDELRAECRRALDSDRRA